MNQLVNKKKRNKKGFTLIELIVVIAILGILAAIAIPRFAGFTDKAKLAADNQYAALVANAAVVLMAEGYLADDVTVDIATGGGITVGGAAIGGSGEPTADAARLKMVDLVTEQPLVAGTAYAITVSKAGVVGGEKH